MYRPAYIGIKQYMGVGTVKGRKQEGKGRFLLGVICACFLGGILFGAVIANSLGPQSYQEYGENLNGFMSRIKAEGISKKGAMADCVIKYGKYLAAIWGCGFLAPGTIFILLLVFYKGIGYGFTTAILVKEYGAGGMAFASSSYLPQNLILVPVYLMMSYISIQFILNRYKNLSPKQRLKREVEKNIVEYMIYFAGACLLLLSACAVEVYFVPAFMTR